MLNKALAYYEQGFWVLPVRDGSKAPGVPQWKQYQTQRPTKAEIVQWWTDNPQANIGFVTGRGPNLCVLDIDSGKDKLQPYLDKYPTNFVVETKKGYHLYFSYPDTDKRLPNTFPQEGVDFRGDGGFIIAPGSIHGSGFTYVHMLGMDIHPPPPLPPKLLGRILAPAKTKDTSEDAWVSRLLSEGSTINNRNTDGTRLAGYLFSKQIPADIVKTMMIPWYENCDRSDNNFHLREMYNIVQSVQKTHIRNTTDVWKKSKQRKSDKTVITLQEFLHGPEDVSWLIDGWLPEATTGLMVAPPGANKTWLALAMGLAVSTGHNFLNNDEFKTHRRGPVLLIQQEDGRNVLRQRLHTICGQMYADAGGIEIKEDGTICFPALDADFDIYNSERLVRFDDPEAMAEIIAKARERRYALVIIDPLYMSASPDNYMASAVQDMAVLKQMRDKFGTSFMLLHHTRKSASSDINRLDAWGSQFLNAWLETGIQLRPIEGQDKSVRVLRHFKNAGSKAVDILTFDINTDKDVRQFKVNISQDNQAMMGAQTGTTHSVLSLLVNGPKTNSEIAEATGLNKSTVSRKLGKLLKDGVVVRDDGTKAYYLEE